MAARDRAARRRRRAALSDPGQRRRLRRSTRSSTATSTSARNADGKVLDMPGGLQLLAYGWSNNTPWNTPREVTEDELFERLDALAAAGARPAPGGVHDPRPAARLGPRHGADPRREPAPDRLGRRRAARPGGLDRRAPRDREVPAAARACTATSTSPAASAASARRVCHQPGQRGQPRHPARLPGRHRQARRRVGRCGSRGSGRYSRRRSDMTLAT